MCCTNCCCQRSSSPVLILVHWSRTFAPKVQRAQKVRDWVTMIHYFIPKYSFSDSWNQASVLRNSTLINFVFRYFRRVENLVEKYPQKSQRRLSSAMKIFGLETELCLTKNGLIMVCNILKMNENGTVMTFKQFEEKYDINTNYITYTGLMCSSCKKWYLRKTGLIVEENGFTDLTKTLQVIYSTRNGATHNNSEFQHDKLLWWMGSQIKQRY